MRYVLLMLAALVLSACGGVTTTTEITTRYTPPTGFMSDRQLYQRQPAQIDLERRDVAKGHMSNVATACIFDRYNAYGICREQDWGGGLVYVCYDRRWLDVQPFGLPLHASKQVQGYRGLTAPVYVVGPVGSYSWSYTQPMAQVTYHYQGSFQPPKPEKRRPPYYYNGS